MKNKRKANVGAFIGFIRIVVMLILIFLTSCEDKFEPVIMKPEKSWFYGEWIAVTNTDTVFMPVGITLTDQGCSTKVACHLPDPDFRTVFEFVVFPSYCCYVRRGEMTLNGWTDYSFSRTYEWSFSSSTLKMETPSTGKHSFTVEFVSRNIVELTDKRNGSIIILEKK